MKPQKHENNKIDTIDESLISFKHFFKRKKSQSKKSNDTKKVLTTAAPIESEDLQKAEFYDDERSIFEKIRTKVLNSTDFSYKDKILKEQERLTDLKYKILANRTSEIDNENQITDYKSKIKLLAEDSYDFLTEQDKRKKDLKVDNEEKKEDLHFKKFIELSKENIQEITQEYLDLSLLLKSNKTLNSNIDEIIEKSIEQGIAQETDSILEKNVDNFEKFQEKILALQDINAVGFKKKDTFPETTNYQSKNYSEQTYERTFNDDFLDQEFKLQQQYQLPSLLLLNDNFDDGYQLLAQNKHSKTEVEKINSFFDEINLPAAVNGYFVSSRVSTYKIVLKETSDPSLILLLKNRLEKELNYSKIRIYQEDKFIFLEIPNKKSSTLNFKEVFTRLNRSKGSIYKDKIRLFLGETSKKTLFEIILNDVNNILFTFKNFEEKEILLNNILFSILFRLSPEKLNLLFVNLKNSISKDFYNLPHLLTLPAETPEKGIKIFKVLVKIISERKRVIYENDLKNIEELNQKLEDKNKLPYLILIVDEIADLFYEDKKTLEPLLDKIFSEGKETGVYLICGIEKPYNDVIFKFLDSYFSVKMIFQTDSLEYSKNFLADKNWALDLLGDGDLIINEQNRFFNRVQLSKISQQELRKVSDSIAIRSKRRYKLFVEDDQQQSMNHNENLLEESLLQAIKIIINRKGKVDSEILKQELNLSLEKSVILEKTLKKMGVI